MTKKQPTMPKTSIRKKLKAGDYFAVPLENGEYGLGQILDMVEFTGDAACVLFDQKFVLGAPITVTPDNIVAARYVFAPLLRRYFPIVHTGEADPRLLKKYFPENERFKRGDVVGMESNQTGIAEMFLNAYFGLTPWDECYDPHFYDDMLVSPDKKPSNLIYSK